MCEGNPIEITCEVCRCSFQMDDKAIAEHGNREEAISCPDCGAAQEV